MREIKPEAPFAIPATMRLSSDRVRTFLMLPASGLFWLAGEQSASAQVLIAQSGIAKTLIGWVLVFLALLLALLVICRPSSRKLPEGDEKRR